MLEYALDIGADGDGLHGIAEQISHHAHVSGVRQFHQDGKVSSMPAQGVVRRAPDPLPTENAAARLDSYPFDVERMAMVAQPFRPELPGLAMRQRCTTRRLCCSPVKYGADNPSFSGTGIGKPVGR